MTQETMNWLYENVLIGNCDNEVRGRRQRRKFWHFNAANAASVANHFDGPVPREKVCELFAKVCPVSRPMFWQDKDGSFHPSTCDRQVVVNLKTGDDFGVFSDGAVHQDYEKALLEPVEKILSNHLGIGSAGLLKKGAIAWVQLETPDDVETPEGVTFYPHLMATTSLNGEIANIFKKCRTDVGCDNTRAAALREASPEYRFKHTTHSVMRIRDAQVALQIIEDVIESAKEEIRTLCQWTVTEKQFQDFLKKLVPDPDQSKMTERGFKRSETMANKKRDAIWTMYQTDTRVTPWRGTAFGALQATNTFMLHEASAARNKDGRTARNIEGTLTGKFDLADLNALDVLRKVTA